MGSKTEVTYFLPVTRARLRCEVTSSRDTILDHCERTTSGLTVELVTVADRDRSRTLVLESGFWRDYAFKLGLTEDGRLVEAGVESTGQVGKVLVGATKLMVGVAALVAGNIPLAVGVGASVVTKSRSKVGPVGFDAIEEEASDTPEDPVAAAYAAAHSHASERLWALTDERVTTLKAVDHARKAYLNADGDDGRSSARRAYRAAREVLDDLELELERAKAHFSAWRKSTVSDTIVVWDLSVPLDALPTFNGEALSFADGRDGVAARKLFDETGEVLAVAGEVPVVPPSTQSPAVVTAGVSKTISDGAAASLHVRRPRRVELVAVAGDDAADVVVTAVHRELVMDERCEELAIPVRKSWNAKRRVDVQLSEMGALTGMEFNGGSSAVAVAGAASEAADSLTGSLESAVKGRATLEALASAGEEAELAQLKRQVALAEQRLLSAGQAATGKDYARLARLKQVVEVSELEVKLTSITGPDPSALR